MTKRSSGIGILTGLAAVMLCTAGVSADTCCANTAVRFAPAAALPGDTVRIEGITCLNPDNTGPLALDPVGFWLSHDRVPADADPGSVPGSAGARLADDLPTPEHWLPFAAVPDRGTVGPGSATIIVPELANGTYQLWWLCDNGAGPGSGIHYSGGPRLAVGTGSPDTATADTVVVDPSSGNALPLPFIAAAAFVLSWRRFAARRASR